MDWSKIDSNVLSLTNIHNRVNADALFVSLVMEMEKRGMDIRGKFRISQIPQIIPRGTAGVTNYAVYGFSVLSMLSGQKQRDYFIFDNSNLKDEFTTMANNNRNRDNYFWLKNYPDEWIQINPKHLKA
jgi:5-methylcytosine-specific restriction protein A